MTPAWFSRPLTLGDEGDDVLIVQRKVDAPLTAVYDEPTAARVRGLQKKLGLKQTGTVDGALAGALGEKATAGQTPEWFGTPEQDRELRRILRLSENEPLADGIRRFQSSHGLALTGEVDEALACMVAATAY